MIRPGKIEEAERLAAGGVKGVREGNAIWPGLIAFTGVTFVVYLLVKAAGGAVAIDVALFAQLGLAGALMAFGSWLLVRARYFHVTIETEAGSRKLGGLTKDEQREIVRRLRDPG